MKSPNKQEMRALISHWRSLIPNRPLTYGQHLSYAREQAHHLRAFADTDNPAVSLGWLLNQRAIPVHLVPSYTLNANSGLTTDHYGGKLQVFINETEPPLRRRYTLLHEWKHVLDFYDSDTLYRNLGTGDEEKQYGQIEAIANEFAAHVLMPDQLVLDVWSGTQDIQQAAGMFQVSDEAMYYRLKKLGLIDRPKKRWRETILFPVSLNQTNCPSYIPCAA